MGEAYGELPTPTREGFQFDGWRVNSSRGELVTQESLVETSGSHTLYASWKVKVDAPTFSVADGSEVEIHTPISIDTKNVNAVIKYTYDSALATAGYTTDNADQWFAYTDAIPMNELGVVTLYAVALSDFYSASDVASVSYAVIDSWTDSMLIENEADRAEYDAFEQKPEGIWVAGLKTVEYTSVAYKLAPNTDFRVYDGVQLLQNKVDYTYGVSKNVNAGTAQITINGRGNYSGRYYAYFTIAPRTFGDAKITLRDGEFYQEAKGAQKPVVVVADYRNNKLVNLSNNREYTVAYYDTYDVDNEIFEPITAAAGEKYAVVTGKGNYTGSFILTYQVEPKDTFKNRIALNSRMVVGFKNKLPYTGNVVEQQYTLSRKVGKEIIPLEEGVDYRIERAGKTAVGPARDLIFGIGEYRGCLTYNYSITGTPFNARKAVITIQNNSLEYKNAAYTLADLGTIKVTYDGKVLTENTDYTIALPTDTTNVGKKTIVITGKNGYSGTLKQTFTITQFNVDADMLLEESARQLQFSVSSSTLYQKGGIKLLPTVTFKGNTMDGATVKKNFNIGYTNNTGRIKKNDDEVVTITITPKANFVKKDKKTKITLSYQIEKNDISGATMTLADKVYSSAANKYQNSPVIFDPINGKKLAVNTDYNKVFKYTYDEDVVVQRKNGKKIKNVSITKGTEVNKLDIIPKGTIIRMTVEGKGNYSGSITGTYRIVGASIANASVAALKTGTLKNGVSYNGRLQYIDKESNFTVKIGKTELLPTDYDIVEYTNNINKGTAKVTLRGRGNYGGTKTITFKINAKKM
jgi:uncharacterized repeat protein (TIGR02543 family)